MKKITKLTKEQETRFGEWRDRWISIGLCTDRADWLRFEKAARECYSIINLNPDVPIIHVSSPMVGAFAAPIAALIINITRELKKLEWTKAFRDQKAVGSAVGSEVGSAVESAVGLAVRSAVGSAVDSAVGSAVDSAVGSAVR